MEKTSTIPFSNTIEVHLKEKYCRFEGRVGIREPAIDRFKSYLSDRMQYVFMKLSNSSHLDIVCRD